MRFSKQPNGQWCGYSTISDSFYCAHLDEKGLVMEVVKDIVNIDYACGNIPSPKEDKALVQYLISVSTRAGERLMLLLENGGYDFDNIIEAFTYDEDNKQTRAHWVRKFNLMGAGKEQMDKVNKRIDYLQENGELK